MLCPDGTGFEQRGNSSEVLSNTGIFKETLNGLVAQHKLA
jgi:hypothetical protein